MVDLLDYSGVSVTVYFYNPNIQPIEEYEIRKQENIEFCKRRGISFIDADYDPDNWRKRTKGFEDEPEKGRRCTICFDMRFERSALYAHENGFHLFSSSLGVSRWKDMNQVNDSGTRAAQNYPDLTYWTFNWRKKGGSQRMVELAKKENFYRQSYCGCPSSLRGTSN